MNQQGRPPGNPQWQPGVSGNPAGRGIGARQRIAEKLLAEFETAMDAGDPDALKRLKGEDPAKFYTIATGLVPRQLEAKLAVETRLPGNLDPQSWASLNRVIDLIARFAPAGADPSEIFETIERALVAAYAEPRLIEHTPAIEPPPY
jgi:hypothetical protein